MPAYIDFRPKNKVSSDNLVIKPPMTRPALIEQDNSDWAKAKRLKEPSAAVNNFIRNLIPLPKNAASLSMKKILGQNKMNTNSLNKVDKAVMAKVIFNAYKRTGKLQGGTEYEDYKGTTNESAYNEILKAKNGKINPLLGTALGATDNSYNMATTVGRGTYTINPNNKSEVIYTDNYNFTNKYTQDSTTGKLKDNYMKEKTGDSYVDFYRGVRRDLAEEDQIEVNPEDSRIKFTLNASDTLNLPKPSSFKNKLTTRFLSKR